VSNSITLDFDSMMNGHQEDKSRPSVTSAATTNANASASANATGTTRAGGNAYLDQPEKGLELCARLITDSDQHAPMAQYRKQIESLIENDFLQACNKTDNTMASQTYAKLCALKDSIFEISCFPHFERSHTVAVGGSFSAGKSFFLNSVLGCDSLLPTDTTPTTSIPTYITQGEADSIQALNRYHKKTDIDEEALKAICHAFGKRFGVTFSHLLQLISVERKDFKYPNLIFLDTPGYSKADNSGESSSKSDENIAREHLRRADYLIWLIEPQNGTIGQADIDFLQSLELAQPVLVIISKADKKPSSQIADIAAQTQIDLKRGDIDFLDVIGYSAKQNKEYSPSGKVLEQLLDDVSQGKNGSTLLWQLDQIFKQHLNQDQSKRESLKLTNKTLKEIAFDEGIREDNKVHLSDIGKKNKDQLNAIQTHSSDITKIHNSLQEQVTQLCSLLKIPTTMQPKQVDLSVRAKNAQSGIQTKTQSLRFDALFKGDMSQLSAVPDISQLKGRVGRISSVGLHIDINKYFEIIIMKSEIKKQLGAIELSEHFSPGTEAKVQIVSDKKAIVEFKVGA
jgi:GTPase